MFRDTTSSLIPARQFLEPAAGLLGGISGLDGGMVDTVIQRIPDF